MKIIFVNPEVTMKTFGTLEYALDKYSGQWTWKLKGKRAVMMASKIIPQLWYGDGALSECSMPPATSAGCGTSSSLCGPTE